METKKILLILVCVVLISIICTAFIFYFYMVEVKEFKMYLTVGTYAGVNVATDAIYFGTITRSGSGSRDVILTNDHTVPIKVHIQAFGELANWVYASDNGFVLEPNEKGSVKITVVVPSDAEFGNYTGTLRINFIKM